MTNRSDRPRPIAGIRHRLLRAGALGAFLVGTLAVVFGAPIAVSAAGSSVVGTSSNAKAFQHSAADKVAYLHDGSLIVGYYNGSNNAIVNHVTNPLTAPISTLADTIPNGSEITFYTLPSTGLTEIWIAVGSELTGGTHQEQVQYGTYDGTNFTWQALTTVPGSLTSGRQNPSVTWNGSYLIDTWWDDTLGGNTDTIFYNWTSDPTGTTGWHVTAKSGTTAAAAIKSGTSSPATTPGLTTIDYNPTSGGAPVMNDLIQFGAGTPNSEIRSVTGVVVQKTGTIALAAPGDLSVSYTIVGGGVPAVGDVFTFGTAGTAETHTVSAVSGAGPYALSVTALSFAHTAGDSATGPYTLTVAALSNPHAVGENDTTAASNVGATSVLYTDTASNAPVAGDMFQIGTAISNDGSVNCSNAPPPLTYSLCDAEFRSVISVSGSGPYTLTVAALSNAHAVGEPIRIAANQLTTTHSNSIQVAIRHSTKLGATVAVYGAACKILTRTLLDTAVDPSSSHWSTERTVDGNDDCENNFGGPQIAIDESNGNIHLFKAVTAGQTPSWTGVTYWLGHMGAGGNITWGARVVIDPSAPSGGRRIARVFAILRISPAPLTRRGRSMSSGPPMRPVARSSSRPCKARTPLLRQWRRWLPPARTRAIRTFRPSRPLRVATCRCSTSPARTTSC